MLPAFLITFREVIEATLIVATVLGVLVKLGQNKSVRTVWMATIAASIFIIALLGLGSLLGVKVQEWYTGRTEGLIEGFLMFVSAIFITCAVFWLHKYFGRYKLALLQKVKTTIDSRSRTGLFMLVFTAVFREGFEIVLFLSTIYLAASPGAVFSGFGVGALAGLLVAASLFTATLKMPVYRAFQASSLLLILFAAGLAGRGIHEFIEAGIIPQMSKVTLAFLPAKETMAADFIKAIFGWSRSMYDVQLWLYALYIGFMRWYLYIRPNVQIKTRDLGRR